MRLKGCILVGALLLMPFMSGCGRSHSDAQKFMEEKLNVGEIIFENEVDSSYSVFLTCENGSVRFVKIFHGFYMSVDAVINIHSIRCESKSSDPKK